MAKIIIVNGAPASGKSLFVSYCIEALGHFGAEYSTIDFVKDIAKRCGWDGSKDLKNRKFLSDLKALLTEWDDVPYKMTKEFIRREIGYWMSYDVDDRGAIFIHCREPQEIKRFKDELGAQTLCVRRTEAEARATSNMSDSEVLKFEYDYIIDNNSTKDDLKTAALLFIENLKNS